MERREFLGVLATIPAIPMIKSSDFFDDSLTVANYRYKLSGNYKVIDFTNEEKILPKSKEAELVGLTVSFSSKIIKSEKFLNHFLLFGDSISVIRSKINFVRGDLTPVPQTNFIGNNKVIWINGDKITPEEGFPLLSEISASKAEKYFGLPGEHYIIINENKILGFSILEKG